MVHRLNKTQLTPEAAENNSKKLS